MVIIVMGVSGCGKSTIGDILAQRLQAEFLDADDFHSEANVKKMSNGIPLTDDDRAEWLAHLGAIIRERLDSRRELVLACSALRQRYRDALGGNDERVVFVHLKSDFKTIERRLNERGKHYMPTSLLKSQFDTLEDPPDAITVETDAPPLSTVESILRQIADRKALRE